MTDRERKARLKIRVADKDIEAAQARLRDALIAGRNTADIRAEIDALRLRIHEADAELADIAAHSYRNQTQRRWDLSTAILATTTAVNEAKLAKLRPPEKSPIEENKL
jgi:hypothetical protein